ncbi:citrate lyase acyl carrier protein [Fusibacter sp. 3D3]|uniref:citrate lyase acyl carrier protein n=1 Tax=Fusibacter sp. 3D3 TaxID=1048380 RepID=UPI000852D8C1|nr:citrate lyase acyl carrier protein [Fusibacter sp. 3D3]GAU79045.1 hypothetical protein F3D3_3681 [Fusibacter sp. 3D3]
MEKNCATGDCIIQFKLKDLGGIKLKIMSSSYALFKDTITQTVESFCEISRIEHAEIELIDGGCLDFVIRARLKTALRRERNSL